jgi:hypothetical protein
MLVLSLFIPIIGTPKAAIRLTAGPAAERAGRSERAREP